MTDSDPHRDVYRQAAEMVGGHDQGPTNLAVARAARAVADLEGDLAVQAEMGREALAEAHGLGVQLDAERARIAAARDALRAAIEHAEERFANDGDRQIIAERLLDVAIRVHRDLSEPNELDQLHGRDR